MGNVQMFGARLCRLVVRFRVRGVSALGPGGGVRFGVHGVSALGPGGGVRFGVHGVSAWGPEVKTSGYIGT